MTDLSAKSSPVRIESARSLGQNAISQFSEDGDYVMVDKSQTEDITQR